MSIVGLLVLAPTLTFSTLPILIPGVPPIFGIVAFACGGVALLASVLAVVGHATFGGVFLCLFIITGSNVPVIVEGTPTSTVMGTYIALTLAGFSIEPRLMPWMLVYSLAVTGTVNVYVAGGVMTESPGFESFIPDVLVINCIIAGSSWAYNLMIDRSLAKLEAQHIALREANERAEEARAHAEDANHAKSAFLASMSHELRTPLNAIIGYSEILEEDMDDDGGFRSDVERIRSAGTHLLRLINDILDLSKIEAGRMPVLVQSMSTTPFFHELSGLVEPLAHHNRNQVRLQLDPTVPSMRTDRTKLQQVLLNLCSNAAKFTTDGVITIRAIGVEVDNVSHVRFEDTGIGISEEAQQRIFEDFVQAKSSTMQIYGGTGLGLGLSRRLAAMLGGTLTVSSSVGTGSVFVLVVPIELEPMSLDGRPPERLRM